MEKLIVKACLNRENMVYIFYVNPLRLMYLILIYMPPATYGSVVGAEIAQWM